MNTSSRTVRIANAATKTSCGPSTRSRNAAAIASEISPDIDHVGDEEESDQRIDDAPGSGGAYCPAKPLPVTRPTCALIIWIAHMSRIGEQERPTQGVAKLRAGLRIGGYAAGIVVRRTGDEAGTHDIGELRALRLFDLVGRGPEYSLTGFPRLQPR